MSSSLRPPPPPPPAAVTAVVRSSRAGVWLGVGLALVGIIAALAWAGLQFVLLADDVGDLRRADPDEPMEFGVDGPVAWTLFVEPGSTSLSGVRFQVVDAASGEPVPLGRYGGSFSYRTPSYSGRAVATVGLDPGRYRLEVVGPATLALGPSPASRLGWLFGGAAVIGMPLVVGGLVVAFVSAIRDTRRRTQAAQPPPPSPWTAGEWPREPGR